MLRKVANIGFGVGWALIALSISIKQNLGLRSLELVSLPQTILLFGAAIWIVYAAAFGRSFFNRGVDPPLRAALLFASGWILLSGASFMGDYNLIRSALIVLTMVMIVKLSCGFGACMGTSGSEAVSLPFNKYLGYNFFILAWINLVFAVSHDKN